MSEDRTPRNSWMYCSCGGRSTAAQSGRCRSVLPTITRDGKLAAGSTSTLVRLGSIAEPSVLAPTTGENVLPSVLHDPPESQARSRIAVLTMAS